ncbi:MAG: tetratricopeptide repeat protein [Candidatus Eisenbacteria bacterium]
MRGHLSEGRDHFLDLIATGHLSPQDRGRALVHSASLIEALGEAERARRQTEEGLAASEAVGDEPGRSNALSMLAMLNLQLGDPATARQQFHQVLEYRRAHLDERSLPLVLNNIGVCSLTLGDWEAAVACYLESLEIALRHEDRATAAVMSINLSGTYLEAGDIENARRYAKESIPLSLAGGDKRTVARSILANADLAAYTGDLVRARTLAREALDYRMGDDDWRHGALAAAILLQIETVADRPEEAAETLGLLERHVGMTELGYLPGRKAMRARVAKDLKKTLGEATFEAAHRRGSLSGIQVLIQRLGDASLDRSSPIPEA